MNHGLFILANYTARFHGNGVAIWLGTVGGALVGFLFGTPAIAYILMALLVLDFLTGVVASLKKGEKFESKRLSEMSFKLLAYFGLILVAASIGLVLDIEIIHTAAIGFVCLSEGVSILENAESLLNGKIPLLKKLKDLLDRRK